MVWERNDRGTDAQDHGGMNLTVSVGIGGSLLLEVPDVHGDHGSLLLLDVEEFTETLSECVVEVHRIFASRLEFLDVLFLQDDLRVLDDEEGPLHPARVREEPHLLVGDIPDDGDLLRNLETSPQLLDAGDEVIGIGVRSYPSTIHEDFHTFAISDRELVVKAQSLDAKVLQDRDQLGCCRADRDESHEGEVLHQAACSTLRSLSRADHPPVGVVELTRLR